MSYRKKGKNYANQPISWFLQRQMKTWRKLVSPDETEPLISTGWHCWYLISYIKRLNEKK